MTNELKLIIREKFITACKREGLDKNEAAGLLALGSVYYGQMVCSHQETQRDKVPEAAWKILQAWTNSGISIRQYAEKHHRTNSDPRAELPDNLKPDIDTSKAKKSTEASFSQLPLDRVKIIFDIINELKRMGFTVDIQIYENKD